MIHLDQERVGLHSRTARYRSRPGSRCAAGYRRRLPGAWPGTGMSVVSSMLTKLLVVTSSRSNDPKKKVRSFLIGPPKVPPNCLWPYGAFSRSIAVAGGREALEVLLRVQRVVAEEEERVAARDVGAALGHDVDHAARRLPELRRVRVGDHLEFAHRFLAERRPHAANDDVVVVETVDGDVVRTGALTARTSAPTSPTRPAAACCRCVTPGVITANEMKLRPLIGSVLICCCVMTLAIAVCKVSSAVRRRR